MDDEHKLYAAILKLRNIEECKIFFRDLCTPKEIQDMKDRWLIAGLLEQGNLSYREINQKTKISLSTITRVARFLIQEPNQGYKLILKREKENV